MDITIPFDNTTEYVYDADKIVVSGGIAKLKTQRPDNATCGGLYYDNMDLVGWSLGAVTGTPTGDVVQGAGYIQFDGGYLDHGATLNVADRQRGCLRCRIQPRWAGGGQPYDVKLFSIFGDAGQKIELVIYRNTVAPRVIYEGDTGDTGFSFSPWPDYTWAQWYTLEWNWDFLNGEHRIFVDGVKVGATRNNTDVFSDAIETLRIGSDAAGTTGQSRMYIKDLLLFDAPQHTTDDSFDPEYMVPATTYPIGAYKITPTINLRTSELTSFVETASKPAGTSVRWLLAANSVYHYYSNAQEDFVPSDGSYGESTQADVISDNLDKLDPEGAICGLQALLYSADGVNTPELSQLDVSYVWSGQSPDDVRLCNVWAWLKDQNGQPSTGQVTVSLVRKAVGYGSNTFIILDTKTYTPETESPNEGLLNMLLATTENMALRTLYKITMASGAEYYITVPDADTANLFDLIYSGD